MWGMELYEAGGFRFDVSDSGPSEGDVVILLHGFPESRRAWEGVSPQLAEAGYRVLAPDQRGYSPGARPRARSAYRQRLLCDDVLALADAAGAERFHVVGHDWGGAVAWSLATFHPERVVTMTSLATPHPRAMVTAMYKGTQLFRSWYMLAFQLPFLPEQLIAGRGQKRFRQQLVQTGLPAEDADLYLSHLAEQGAATGALNWYRAMPFETPWKMSPVSVPVLYVYAGNDAALGRKAADLTEGFVQGDYRFEVLRDASHWLPEERPAEIARLVLDHVGRFSVRADGGGAK
jgi:pimeloyl-ACP methyl ester carboxylesterase